MTISTNIINTTVGDIFMVALFVLLTFVSFITIDFLLHRSKYNFTLADRIIAGMILPLQVKKINSHEPSNHKAF